MSKPRKPNQRPAGKPTYIWGGVIECENELTVGKTLPPVVELVSPRLDHPERIAQLRAELAAFDAANETIAKLEAENAQLRAKLTALDAPSPPTQDPA